jgi:acetyl esterase/lipase
MNQTGGNFRLTKTQKEGSANERFSIPTTKLNHTGQMSAVNPTQNPKVEHRIRDFLKALNSGGGKPIETLTPAEARQVLVDAQASVRLALPACDLEAKTITQDGLKVSLTIVRPAGSKTILPAFIFVHGGGWILGDFPTHERFVRDLVADSGFTAVFVNYTPSPEAHYPTAINEIYAATRWVAGHGAEINVDGKRLAIVGNSVGGNMTAAVALMAKDKGTPELKCQIMFWPVTDANFETESYREYADGYFLSRAMMMWFWDAYAPDRLQRGEIYAAPLQATLEQLKGLPPALIQAAGNDVLRDEGLAYARNLDFAGVDVTVVRYENLIHDYGLLNAISQVPAVRDALHQAAEMLKKHLK